MIERKRRWRFVIGLVVGLVMVGAYVLSPRWLYVETPCGRAEVIIVLGGDAEGRVLRKEEGRRQKEEGGGSGEGDLI